MKSEFSPTGLEKRRTFVESEIECVMGDRISLLQFIGLNPFADQDFFPVEEFHLQSLWGKKANQNFAMSLVI